MRVTQLRILLAYNERFHQAGRAGYPAMPRAIRAWQYDRVSRMYGGVLHVLSFT